jgi:hypothetical protein
MTACPLCRRPAEDRHARCRQAVDDRLRQIPGLYRLLAAVLEPGSATTARVSGSRTPPIPARVEPLSLRGRGGIIAILATWETDWRERRGLPPVPARAGVEQLLTGDQAVDDVSAFLRAHLDWAIDHHPAVDAFAGEVREIVDSCYQAVGARNDLMRVGRCPTVDDDSETTCGQILYADPYAHTIRCTRCNADWPRARWLILGQTLAETSRTDHAA